MKLEKNILKLFTSYKQVIFNCLDGYHISDEEIDEAVCSYFDFLYNKPQIPIYELKKGFNLNKNILSPELYKKFEKAINKLSSYLANAQQNRTTIDELTYITEQHHSTTTSTTVNNPIVNTSQIKQYRTNEIFDELLKAEIQKLHSLLVTTSNIPINIEQILNKYFYGYTIACCAELTNIISTYIDVEEVFHNSEFNVPGLVLHSKRPEMTCEQLLHYCRSHQALKAKSKLLLCIINILKENQELMSIYEPLDIAIRRLSQFNKIEYTKLTDETRLLLLSNRNGPPFDEYTQELIYKLWDILDRNYTSPNSPNTNYSFRALTNKNIFLEVGNNALNDSNDKNAATDMFSFRDLYQPALDFTVFPTECLLIIVCHEHNSLRKLALRILLLRMYGIKPGKITDLVIHSKDECWDIYDPILKKSTNYEQKKNELAARWTHEALITYNWLKKNCDVLVDHNQNIESNNTNSELVSPIINENTNHVSATSRLHHMLNVFSKMPGDNGGLERQQQTIAFLINNSEDIEKEFKEKLQEIMEIEMLHVDQNNNIDGKLLFCLVVDLHGNSNQNFVDIFSANSHILEAIHVNFICILLMTNDCTKHRSSIVTSNSLFSDVFINKLSKTPPMLKYFYFRNYKVLKINGTNTADEPYIREESLLRNCELPLLYYLELKRMRNFFCTKINTAMPTVHIYEGYPKCRKIDPPRYFVRLIANISTNLANCLGLYEMERILVAGINNLELEFRENRSSPNNHILLCVNYINNLLNTNSNTNQNIDNNHMTSLTPNMAEQIVRDLYEKYAKRFKKLQIKTLEVRFKTRLFKTNKRNQFYTYSEGMYPYRIILEADQSLRTRRYVEIQNPSTGDRIFAALDSGDTLSTLFLKSNATNSETDDIEAKQISKMTKVSDYYNREEYDGKPIDVPHMWAGKLENKRAITGKLQTIYVYDFVDLIELAVRNSWRQCPKFLLGSSPQGSQNADQITVLLPDRLVEVVELILNKNNEIIESTRPPGQNECGMVAWKMILRTPEFPKGRRIIVIANDVTFQMGTFGIQEDLLFLKVSQLARELGIPRIYIAVNSGARMGLDKELLSKFKVEWMKPSQPQMGYKYIYLTEQDYQAVGGSKSVYADKIINDNNETVWKINDIIGKEIGLGVENLCGSAAIAGETSRCYKEAFTITYVTGRTVGIGAYLARLGHRVIQKVTEAPIILTGFQALNKLIGKHVYTSNNELGGPNVMYKNGITHQLVNSDLEGCSAIIKWLSYIPEHKSGPLPVMIDPNDTVNRPVTYYPSSLTNDPRCMLKGCTDAKGVWQGGILDKDSFTETMSGYAQSVICGRGRIGGLPIGVISVETRVTDLIIPADPAMPMSAEQKLVRAGQVWFPESAYKTAQAINDFNREELPLLVLANWRGFSGGQRDMFHEVLKFGSMIVDALVDYKQPCVIYLPPKGELRGGAWVVVDPRINPKFIEMFADPESRGGVLEPTGIVEIKFREKLLREVLVRSDDTLRNLETEVNNLISKGISHNDNKIIALEEAREKRFELLLPIMRQVAVHFADLHDTAARMFETKVISKIIPWETSRQAFYWHFRSQLIYHNLLIEIKKHDERLSDDEIKNLIEAWVLEAGRDIKNAQEFVNWTCNSVTELVKKMDALKNKYIASKTIELCNENLYAVTNGLKQLDKTTYDRLLVILTNST